jgi:hypothetical protein
VTAGQLGERFEVEAVDGALQEHLHGPDV